jgi:hypothetical protein
MVASGRAGFARLFTVDQANAMLPLVRAIVCDVVRLATDVSQRRERLALLLGRHGTSFFDHYHDELRGIEASVALDARRRPLGASRSVQSRPPSGTNTRARGGELSRG